jgi:hypothetical protein
MQIVIKSLETCLIGLAPYLRKKENLIMGKIYHRFLITDFSLANFASPSWPFSPYFNSRSRNLSGDVENRF